MDVVLEIIYIILTGVFSIACIYQLVIIASGIFKKCSEKAISTNRINKLCVLVCARNEEGVIGNLIKSITEQDYPKEMTDIYVVADNCTDETAKIAQSAGANVFVRNDSVHIGKGFALKFFFERIDINAYDGFCIFDADNIASPCYLREINTHMNKGEKIIQGFRAISNPAENAISSCYTLYFSFIMKLYMRARYNKGMSCMVGGTGFAFTSDLVKNGWNTESLTEDAEFSMQNIMQGTRVALAETAVFYDEQPTSFVASISQRHRWTVGTMQLLKNYTKPLLHAGKTNDEHTKLSCIDAIMFMIMAPVNALPIFSGLLSPIMLLALGLELKTTVLILLGSAVASYLSNILVAYVASYAVGYSAKELWRGILFYPIFSISWSFISLFACIRRKCVWKPIVHKGTAKVKRLNVKGIGQIG